MKTYLLRKQNEKKLRKYFSTNLLLHQTLGITYLTNKPHTPHDYITLTDAIPLNKWTNLDIAQSPQSDGSYNFKITIDGVTVLDIINNSPKEFKNVKVSGW